MANFKNNSFIRMMRYALSAWLMAFVFTGCSDDQSAMPPSVYTYSEQEFATSEPTYIYVENDNLEFDSYSGSRSIPVICDGDWELEEYPAEWVEASCGYFTLKLDVEYNEGSYRETSLTLRAGEYRCVIRISQEGAPPFAMVHEIWTDFNQNYYGTWGMVIHAKFTVNNLKGEDIEVGFRFYDEYGDPLYDNNGRYCDADGYVCIAQRLHVYRDESEWNDFKLFFPYQELHVNPSPGDAFNIVAVIMHNGEELDSSCSATIHYGVSE